MAGNTRQQDVRRIWGIAKSPELQLTEEELHLVVSAHTGEESIKALTTKQIRTVIKVLLTMKESAAMASGSHGRDSANGNQAAVSQRKKIFMLAKELGWESPVRVNGMCRKMFGVSAVEWLDPRQCAKLIEALKAMVKRKKRGGGSGKEKEDDSQGEENQCRSQKAAAEGRNPPAG